MKRSLEELGNNDFDLLVVGAGIHGACVARDAALRGLKVGIVDKGDFGGATSHNSLKTIHGGIRYLQHLNFSRALESIKEQMYWLRTAPHLMRPLPFVMPTYGHGMRGPVAMRIGLGMYRLLGLGAQFVEKTKGTSIPPGRVVGVDECLQVAPGIDTENLTGAAIWHDAQVVRADLATLSIMEHACQSGVTASNYTKVTALICEGNVVVGVKLKDLLTGNTLECRSKVVVNAAGPWVAELLEGSGVRSLPTSGLPLARSMNIVTDKPASSHAVAFKSLQQSDSLVGNTNRLYFAVPWKDKLMLGTAYEPFDSPADQLSSAGRGLDRFLAELNDAWPDLDLTDDNVLYCYEGVTPVQDSALPDSTPLHHTRIVDHAEDDGIAGLISIVSIKWTTARIVGENTVSLVLRKLGIESRPCMTRHTVIPEFADLCCEFSSLADEDIEKRVDCLAEASMIGTLSDLLLRRTDDLVLDKLSDRQIQLICSALARKLCWSESQRSEQKSELLEAAFPEPRLHRLEKLNFWSVE